MARYTIPRKFKGENRIFIIFTQKSFVYTIIGSALGFGILKLFMMFGHEFVGLIIGFLIALPFYLFGSHVNSKDIPYNGGEDADKVFIRRFRNKFTDMLYISNYDE